MSDDRLKGGFEEGEGDGGGRSNNPGPSIREDVVIEWIPKIDPERPGREREPDADELPHGIPERIQREIERERDRLP